MHFDEPLGALQAAVDGLGVAPRLGAVPLALVSVSDSTAEVTTTRATGPGPLLLLAALLTCWMPAPAVGQTCVAQCTADCDDGGTVTVDELLKAVIIALGNASVDACAVADRNGDGSVTVDELVRAASRWRCAAARSPPPRGDAGRRRPTSRSVRCPRGTPTRSSGS